MRFICSRCGVRVPCMCSDPLYQAHVRSWPAERIDAVIAENAARVSQWKRAVEEGRASLERVEVKTGEHDPDAFARWAASGLLGHQMAIPERN
jgi:hypothetical protein